MSRRALMVWHGSKTTELLDHVDAGAVAHAALTYFGHLSPIVTFGMSEVFTV
jgi:hypothetical protein